MITAAALCPSPPLLHPALTGGTAVVPELRAACAQAVSWLLRDDPGEIAVLGPAVATGEWDAAGRMDPAAFAPGPDHPAALAPGPDHPAALAPGPDHPAAFAPGVGGRWTRSAPLPLSLGLGALLLDQAGYRGRRRLLAVGQDESASTCAGLGAGLGERPGSVALLVMGDGSARRSLKAPGYLDPRAAGFDAEVERAVRAGDLDSLLRLDQGLARELMATGRAAWQVLAGAMRELAPVAEVRYRGDPFGVAYLVACLQPRAGPAGTGAGPGRPGPGSVIE